MPDSLQPHEPQHARPPCPSPTPGVYPNPCPLSPWCHPITSSCRPLLILPSVFPSIRVFSNESALHIRWPKYWSLSFNISPSNEHPGLISFRMDWLDLLAVQGTLKSLLQHQNSKASILRILVESFPEVSWCCYPQQAQVHYTYASSHGSHTLSTAPFLYPLWNVGTCSLPIKAPPTL